MAGIDWITIKNDYINSVISQRDLAKKYNVSVSTLTKRANKEHWQQTRETHSNKIEELLQQKSANEIVNSEIDKLKRINALSDKLIQKLEEAAEQLNNHLVTNKVKIKTVEYKNKNNKPTKETIEEKEDKVVVVGDIDRIGLKTLTAALKDLKDIATNKNDEINRDVNVTISDNVGEYSE